jgi:uncharacterized protein (TIGR03083 family)
MITAALSPVLLNAASIPYVTADEAYQLMGTELQRFLALVETLDASDWERPTACSLWNVRDMLAHQAGGYTSGAGYKEMIHQYSALPRKGELAEDAVNRRQLAERAGSTPAELIAELRQVGPIAIRKWAYQFRLAKLVTIPRPDIGSLSLRHLMMVIHSRDTWMHRLDICRATGKRFEQTADHDGRIAALVMRDLAKTLPAKLGVGAVRFELSGIAGGNYQIGTAKPTAAIAMDVLDFNIYASGRFSFRDALGKAKLSGDLHLAEKALKNTLVLY